MKQNNTFHPDGITEHCYRLVGAKLQGGLAVSNQLTKQRSMGQIERI